MSVNLSNVLVTEFQQEVHQRFQEEAKLRNTVRVKDAAGAKKVNFNLMGRGKAALRGAIQTPIPTMNISHALREATVENYVASELTDIFLDNQVKFDEKQELVQSISMALGRQLDQIIIDEMAAASYTGSLTIPNNVSGAAADLTVDAIRAAAKAFDEEGVPDSERHMAIHPSGLHNLLESTEATSSDFMTVKALVKGDLDSFYGFKLHKIGNRDEGGLAINGSNDRSNFFYQKMAFGLAVNMEPKIRIDWAENYGAHRVTGYLSAGGVIIDDKGVGKITTREA